MLHLDAPKVPKLELPSVQFAFAMHLAVLVSSHPPQWAVAMKFKVGQRLATSDIIARKPPTGPPNMNQKSGSSSAGFPPPVPCFSLLDGGVVKLIELQMSYEMGKRKETGSMKSWLVQQEIPITVGR